MAREAVHRGALAAALLLVPALAAAPYALGDHAGCPLFERQRFDFTTEMNLGAALFAVEHVAGFTDYRECQQLRQQVTTEEVRFESRGGAYVVHVVGERFEDTQTLHTLRTSTGWYDVADVRDVAYVGADEQGRVALRPPADDVPPPPRAHVALT